MFDDLKFHIQIHAVDHCTLACDFCGAGVPFLPRRAYRVEDYLPWLELLASFAVWETTAYAGGEPFLHPDLAGLIRDTHQGHCVHIVTNGFWLLRKDWEEVGCNALGICTVLFVSRCPVYVDRLGVEEWDRRLAIIRARTGVPVHSFHPDDPRDLTFAYHKFHRTPHPIYLPPECKARSCFDLLPDGRIGKCPYARALGKMPEMTLEFSAAGHRSLFYDLRSRRGEGWAEWAATDYVDACHYCGLATGHLWSESWKRRPRSS